MTTSVVIPVKQLANAKQRLAGFLSPEQRSGLFKAMVEDVLEAVTVCDRIDDVYLITNDDEVAELARAYGAQTLTEPAQPGLIEAVTEAGTKLQQSGVETMVFLPGDVPLVSAEELEIVLDGFGHSDNHEFLIVPASDLGGSNCVLVSPPDCMTFGFGEDSFRRHLRLARERGINPGVARLPGIGLDVDTPADLFSLIKVLDEQGLDTHTSRFLRDSGIAEMVPADLASIG
ncbi:MAG: 2-phospho-L-lactate guanylyltransferase [Pseudomonadales bacterium]|nr:2-phospho-L-lactate guanylyltransferase [Pseudomonadales bacterium]